MKQTLLTISLILFALTSISNSKSYEEEIFYPKGQGPFPVVILSHGKGGPAPPYYKKAASMSGNGFVAIVLDHYSARGKYGNKFKNFPEVREGMRWRQEDIVDVLNNLKNKPKIDRKKVILAGWSAGAGIVLPIISNPNKINVPSNISIAGAILTYPYTYGCYFEIESFNVPVLILYGKLDGSKKPLSGIHCWKDKTSRFKNNKHPLIFKSFDNAYHRYDFPMLKTKICIPQKYKDGVSEVCHQFNEKAFKSGILEMKKFLLNILDN